jgi:hypothetical protein
MAVNTWGNNLNSKMRVIRWMWAGLAASLMLAGCGGGGGGGSGEAPPPPPDVRNGEYTAFAADAQQYALNLNFDAMTYSVSGNSLNVTGTFALEGSKYVFLPAPTGSVQNTAKFSVANDTVVGGFPAGAGVIPFVAPRTYVTRVDDAVGTYNFLSRTVDPAGTPNNSIFNGEITASGLLRTCNDLIIYTIDLCPAASVVTGTVTVSGSDFTALTPNGTILFRVARIGSDKVLLRASASAGTSRRFWVGTPAVAYTPGTFSVVNTLGHAGTATVSLSEHSSTLVEPDGTTVNVSGTSRSTGLPTGLLALDTADLGKFFAIRGADIAVIVASRDSTQAPALVQIGRP